MDIEEHIHLFCKWCGLTLEEYLQGYKPVFKHAVQAEWEGEYESWLDLNTPLLDFVGNIQLHELNHEALNRIAFCLAIDWERGSVYKIIFEDWDMELRVVLLDYILASEHYKVKNMMYALQLNHAYSSMHEKLVDVFFSERNYQSALCCLQYINHHNRGMALRIANRAWNHPDIRVRQECLEILRSYDFVAYKSILRFLHE